MNENMGEWKRMRKHAKVKPGTGAMDTICPAAPLAETPHSARLWDSPYRFTKHL